MVTTTLHGDGSVSVTPSVGQTGGEGTGTSAGKTYKNREEALAGISSESNRGTNLGGSLPGVRPNFDMTHQGRDVSEADAHRLGLIDRPGEFGTKAVGAGVSSGEVMRHSSQRSLDENMAALAYGQAVDNLNNIPRAGSAGVTRVPVPSPHSNNPFPESEMMSDIGKPKIQAAKDLYTSNQRTFDDLALQTERDAHPYYEESRGVALGKMVTIRKEWHEGDMAGWLTSAEPGKRYAKDILGFASEVGDATTERTSQLRTYNGSPVLEQAVSLGFFTYVSSGYRIALGSTSKISGLGSEIVAAGRLYSKNAQSMFSKDSFGTFLKSDTAELLTRKRAKLMLEYKPKEAEPIEIIDVRYLNKKKPSTIMTEKPVYETKLEAGTKAMAERTAPLLKAQEKKYGKLSGVALKKAMEQDATPKSFSIQRSDYNPLPATHSLSGQRQDVKQSIITVSALASKNRYDSALAQEPYQVSSQKTRSATSTALLSIGIQRSDSLQRGITTQRTDSIYRIDSLLQPQVSVKSRTQYLLKQTYPSLRYRPKPKDPFKPRKTTTMFPRSSGKSMSSDSSNKRVKSNQQQSYGIHDPLYPASLENVTLEEMSLGGGRRARHIRSRGKSQKYFSHLVSSGQPIPTLSQSRHRKPKSNWRKLNL